MPKKYNIEREYEQREEKKIFSELKNIKERGKIIYTREVPYTKIEYGILINEPDLGCFLELSYLFKNEIDEGKIIATITTVKEDRPKILGDLEKILGETAKEIKVK